MYTTLGEVLGRADSLPWNHALYASPEADLTASTPVLVWDVDDVDEDTELPAEASARGYDYVIGIQAVQGVVANTRQQRSDASVADLLTAFRFYLERDAFIQWDPAGG